MSLSFSRWPLDKKKVTRVKKVFYKLGFSKLPNPKKEVWFYRLLTQNLYVTEIAQNHRELTPHLMNAINNDYNYLMQLPAIDIGFTNTPLTLSEFHLIWLPMGAAKNQLSPNSKLYKSFDLLAELMQKMAAHLLMATHVLMSRILLAQSNLIGLGFLTYTTEHATYSKNGEFVRNRIMISLKKPEKLHISIAGKTRTVFEVLCYPQHEHGCHHMVVQHKGKTIPCYIQSHAYRRIPERFDICSDWIARESAFTLSEECETIQYKDFTLLPVDLYEKRMGYFLCEEHQGVLVLKTFKLVTHLGTPEGDQFNRMLNLEKEQLSTLQLDKLSSFLASNLKKDSLIHDLILQSNLSYLATMDLKELMTPPHLLIDTMKNMNDKPLIILGL